MRYFKMGVSRLILEAEVAPIVIPMFHSGMETVMVENKIPPQFLPSIRKTLRIKFGEPIPEERIAQLRERWRRAKEHPNKTEIRALRMETVEMVRKAVNDVRTSMGFPPEPPNSNDPKSFPPITVPPRKDFKGWMSRK
jgi:monolysocardiolipin acyltransferase